MASTPSERTRPAADRDATIARADLVTDRWRPPGPEPRDVEGFAAAVSAGVTPDRPATPPSIAGRPTARRAFIGLATTFGVATAAAIACLVMLPGGRVSGLGAVAFFAVLAIGYLAIRASLHRFRDIFLAELQAGYATTTFTQGLFWIPRGGSGRRTWGDDVVGWNWDGLWVLDIHGNVVSAPDGSIDPPGLYPSPHRVGKLELWTGYRWTGVFPTS